MNDKLKCEQCGDPATTLESEIALPGVDVSTLRNVCSKCNDKNREKVIKANDPLSQPGPGAINK